MQSEKPKKKQLQNQEQKRFQYEVCEVESAGCIQKYGMYVSEPWKYAGTHILLHCGMILHYYATFGYLHTALGVINIVLHVLCTVTLVILAFTDPGMVPKILIGYQKKAYRKIPTNYHHCSTLLRYYQKQYWTVIKGHNLKLKFCNTCYIYRPPRTVHCEDCGICVEKFDHHCPWIGTCVAKRNYKYFLLFLGVLSALTLKLFIQTIAVTAQHTRFLEAQLIAKSVINIFLCIYILPAMGFALFMFGLHLKFVATNVTTNEFCKQTWKSLQGNPFKKKSWIKNLLKIISLHYQGKVRLDERVYDRSNNLVMENDSITSLNDSKSVNKTLDHLDNIKEFKYKNRKNYSSGGNQTENNQNRTLRRQAQHSMRQQHQQIRLQFNKQKPKQQSTHYDEPASFDTQQISLYDIGIRITSNNKQTREKSEKKSWGRQVSNHSENQKLGTSLQSDRDDSEYKQDELDREENVKLKVITEENEPDHQLEINVKAIPIRQNENKSPGRPSNQLSIIKVDEQQSSEMGSKVTPIKYLAKEKLMDRIPGGDRSDDFGNQGQKSKQSKIQKRIVSLGNKRKGR